MYKKHFLLFVFVLAGFVTHAQMAYRMKADILTKSRMPDSTFQVSKGVMYYDQNHKKIIFHLTFPKKEEVVLCDTVMYVFENGALQSKTSNYLVPEQSVFHFMLSGKMANYGLEASSFKAVNVERKKDMVITTWEPPSQLKKLISKILVATQNKKLYSVTMVDGEGTITNRQILKKYQLIDGLDIPTEILIATYFQRNPFYQIINLSNIVINENGNENIYNRKL